LATKTSQKTVIELKVEPVEQNLSAFFSKNTRIPTNYSAVS
jgi:tRNA U55 pseudouridine synthase TruB